MTGYVYFVLDRVAQTVKIGYSQNPDQRLCDIQVCNANDLELVYRIEGTKRDEAIYHETFRTLLIRGEWYRCAGDLAELLEHQDPDPVLSVEHYQERQIQRHFKLLGDGGYELLFGKHYGERLSEVIMIDYDYIDWIIWNSDFDEAIKEFLADHLN